MKHKAKVRRRHNGSPQAIGETAVALSSAPAPPGRSGIEGIDEHKSGSIESVPRNGPQSGVAGFIEPDAANAGGAR